MKYYLVQGIKMWGVFVLFTVLSLVFMMLFTFVVKSDTLVFIYSCITALWFLSKIYAISWENGKKDSRKTPAHPYRAYNGIVFGIVSVVPSVIIMIVYQLNVSDMASLIYKFYLSTFIGFIDHLKHVPAYVSLLIYATVPVASGIGYAVGKRRFSVLDTYLPKIVYKSK